MSTNLEIEAKALLSKEDYEKLISTFKADKIYEQINYYIDTPNHDLVNQKYGLRIRSKDRENELTLKVPQVEGKLEINQQISNKELELMQNSNIFPNGEIKDYLKEKSNSLHILGKLITKRLDLEYKTSLISIDESKYNGISDYEIEAEDSSLQIAESNLKAFLKENGIVYRKSKHSKLKRFLQSL